MYKRQVFIPTKEYFGGLFGVFGDSLPDGWGNLLLNRMLRKKGMKPEEMTMLNRLAIVGQSGMGALTYRPEEHFSFEPQGYDLDDLALQCQKILNTEYSEKLDELYLLGGTSGGARPKDVYKRQEEHTSDKCGSNFNNICKINHRKSCNHSID